MSIYVTNFSMYQGEVIECVDLVDFSVEITDSIYDITVSGT